jgi:hypothetical protein
LRRKKKKPTKIQNSHNNIKKKSEFIGKQKQKQAKKVQKERIEKI